MFIYMNPQVLTIFRKDYKEHDSKPNMQLFQLFAWTKGQSRKNLFVSLLGDTNRLLFCCNKKLFILQIHHNIQTKTICTKLFSPILSFVQKPSIQTFAST